jgi:hypothetical protein
MRWLNAKLKINNFHYTPIWFRFYVNVYEMFFPEWQLRNGANNLWLYICLCPYSRVIRWKWTDPFSVNSPGGLSTKKYIPRNSIITSNGWTWVHFNRYGTHLDFIQCTFTGKRTLRLNIATHYFYCLTSLVSTLLAIPFIHVPKCTTTRRPNGQRQKVKKSNPKLHSAENCYM